MGKRVLSDGVVTLRPWTEEDAPEIVACIDADAEMASWLDQLPQPYTLQHARAYARAEHNPDEITWAVTDAASGRVLGSIGASPRGDDVWEVGYWLRRDARGRGWMTRALALVAHWVFQRKKAARLQLRADPENVASCRVAERAGFTREGVLRSAHWNARLGRRQDWVMFSLLPPELP